MDEIAKFGTQLPNGFMQTGPNQMQEVEKRITLDAITPIAIQLYGG
jgi:hypothetical protein